MRVIIGLVFVALVVSAGVGHVYDPATGVLTVASRDALGILLAAVFIAMAGFLHITREHEHRW